MWISVCFKAIARPEIARPTQDCAINVWNSELVKGQKQVSYFIFSLLLLKFRVDFILIGS